MKIIRILIGVTLAALSFVLAILPGSVLFLLAGLVILSIDIPLARVWLKKCQSGMTVGAKKIDRILLNRRLDRY